MTSKLKKNLITEKFYLTDNHALQPSHFLHFKNTFGFLGSVIFLFSREPEAKSWLWIIGNLLRTISAFFSCKTRRWNIFGHNEMRRFIFLLHSEHNSDNFCNRGEFFNHNFQTVLYIWQLFWTEELLNEKWTSAGRWIL